MEDKIKKLLINVRSLAPSQEFFAISKARIIGTPQEQAFREQYAVFNKLRFVAAFSLASFLLIFGFVGNLYVKEFSSALASSIQSGVLLDEANVANFQIQIQEARYYAHTAEQVAVALDEIANGRQAP